MNRRELEHVIRAATPTTATLPRGWEARLIAVRGPGTRGAIGWCVEAHDLVVSKLVASRDKDLHTEQPASARALRPVCITIAVVRTAPFLALCCFACGSPAREVRRDEAVRELMHVVQETPEPEEEPAAPLVVLPEHDGVSPNPIEGIADALEVVLGRSHTCVRRGGAVSCWGANHAGQLGPATSEPTSSRAIDVPGVTDAVELFAGAAHTCARRQNGSVVCWGDNRFAQLGGGSAEERSPREVSGVRGATALAGNLTRTCAVLANGRARCWGRYLGHDYAMSSGYADPSVGAARARSIVQLGLAESYGCALLRGARISCWGQNEYGQLGRETAGDGFSPSPAGVIRAIASADEISVAESHACARTNDHVMCWGLDTVGEVGGENLQHAESTVPPSQVPGVEHAAQISAGAHHNCARHDDGRVSCWGSNVFGELGAGGRDDSGPVSAPIDDAVDLATGEHHTCVVRRTGAVVCWGRNECGEVGAPIVAREGWECAYELDEPTPSEGSGGFLRAAD